MLNSGHYPLLRDEKELIEEPKNLYFYTTFLTIYTQSRHQLWQFQLVTKFAVPNWGNKVKSR